MPPRKKDRVKKHNFKDKLILNQWLISLFGIDPLIDHIVKGKKMRPFNKLADMVEGSKTEGLGEDNLHYFYKNLFDMFGASSTATITKEQLLNYEENIVRHTQKINEKRDRPIVWKYYQWLNLLFVEIYLDRYFNDRQKLLNNLNDYISRFNGHYPDYAYISDYSEDDLNKICFQNATGSGKTLIMHVNFLQFKHYSKTSGSARDLSRSILITPNERLSEQHINELALSGIGASAFIEKGGTGSLIFANSDIGKIDVLEITKLADTDGPKTIAARSLGDNNLLFVDEGHRGMSGKEEGAWFKRRADLCSRGFTFEYSATFQQAVAASKSDEFEDSYSKSVIFDYSYRWFYEDGFGKDYQILNLPKSFNEVQNAYLVACLLRFYQQLRIYEERKTELASFNIEKPLWVFVGSTVTKAKGGGKDDEIVATDVAMIVQFIAGFLSDQNTAKAEIKKILTGKGQDTGLLDADGNDIFHGSFSFLNKKIAAHDNIKNAIDDLYKDILAGIFQNRSGGRLNLCRIKGDSGEIALKIGDSETPFGLINVGDAAGLCEHCEKVCKNNVSVIESDFSQSMFNTIKDSSSPVNLLIGSKKFIEGWDCWRVSTMGLMHVGKSEGAQIIQLFGRGVRLKGYGWSLKRSGYANVTNKPVEISELELLNVFGIEADFMEKFREYLKEEGLPGNEKRQTFSLPLNVTYDIDKKLKMLKPKVK
ncbi:MAG TPA: DEAD/DEAH box helicase family protein, partial [Candidatus Wallbacteria bacterium]|nr:DEAD/DEAH box helicase family protein [Candidatus Wallbacteria bacterium]